ncbi:MAG: COX15/CtaA family protein [Bacteroidia bacterium]
MARLTVGAVLFLIFVGGLVRMTGSGMGCPDWPRCFGKLIPPTDISQLPEDYKTRFAVQGREIADFDPVKTWIEYINRLIGAVIGLLGLLTVFFSWKIRKENKAAFRWSLAGLFFVLLAAGIGAQVVKSDLHTGRITLHMVIALLTVFSFVMATFTVADEDKVDAIRVPRHIWGMAGILLVFTLIQVLMGTQVREQVDEVAKALGEAQRADWIGELTGVYHIHKVFHYGIFLVLIGMSVQLKPYWKRLGPVKNMFILVFILLLMEMLLGVSMHNMGLPAWIQPLHLLVAALIFAAEAGAGGWMYLANKKALQVN